MKNLDSGNELKRLDQDQRREKNWKRWGPYVAERQWGTVREDYSEHADPWLSFTHDQARSRAYRWGEDGLLGLTDRECRLCFALAMWNRRDPILKERLFGLTGHEGNHGEDVKELYFYLDSTPSHSYMKALYKYPQSEFPYRQIIDGNRYRDQKQPEFELIDTGVFNESRYFDVFAEYAKASPDDMLIRLTVCNCGPDRAELYLLPTLWFRNTWIWGCRHEGCTMKPRIEQISKTTLATDHETLGRFRLEIGPDPDGNQPRVLFTENETNTRLLYGVDNYTPYVKDAFHRYLIHGHEKAISPDPRGTKAAPCYRLSIPGGGEVSVRLRLTIEGEQAQKPLDDRFDRIFDLRCREADRFYAGIIPEKLPSESKTIIRQAYAGLLWNKQFYHYVVEDWLQGDPGMPPPPQSRDQGRNSDWPHLFNRDVISMPDKWEYPWYAAWDLAFHMIPFAKIDPHFTKQQLILFLREWYMHPNGQIPAYEYSLSDVNPPVHAWACWRVYKIAGPRGRRDQRFLASAFQKLLLNFTWWVNRKDPDGNHIFAGGFLGLDNIGLFDRSQYLPSGGRLNQADGTAWMAFYCGTMLSIALELALEQPEYEDMASKFFEHFVNISDAINTFGGRGLWNEQDGFYYDELSCDDRRIPLKVRSLVGIVPLLAVEIIEQQKIDRLPGFKKRMNWFLENRGDLAKQISYMACDHAGDPHAHYLLAIPSKQRLTRTLKYVLDENEFLSPFGIRSLSRFYRGQPYTLHLDHEQYRIEYAPGESDTALFGGNSNWRGPIWLPLNYLLIEALERYHHFYGDSLKVEFPTGSGRPMNLKHVAEELAKRISRLFLPDENGSRPCHGGVPQFARDPRFKDLSLFHEYYHADTGRGLGADHQTGWTALIIRMLEEETK